MPTDVGYSGTPLPQKLGIKPGHRLLPLGAPEEFLPVDLGPLDGVTVLRRAVTEVWSGLRFVVRVADRATWPVPPSRARG